ncbi:MAG: hypothetical protein J1E85_00265 [Ruminococcus sp.]|nr:hypothetical protein [Ruminococcus sp.]
MNNNLIERYIYAVTKMLPANIQKDVSQEIRGLIDDMLCERCGDVVPSEKDIRVVLTELGSPKELAEKYDTSVKNCLIGPPYFVTYKYVLKIVLICVGIGILSSMIATIIKGFEDFDNMQVMLQNVNFWTDLFANIFTNLIVGLIFGFAFVTLLFAIFYHKDIKIGNEKLDNLPPLPKKELSKIDSILGIAFSVAVAVVFIAVPQIFFVVLNGNKIIPIFNISEVQSVWYLVVIFALLGIVRETVKLIEKQYSKKVMITTIIADVFSAVIAAFWLFNENIINKNFVAEITNIFDDNKLIAIFSQFNYFFFGCIMLALTIDVIVTVVKTIKNRD